jgi:hypothetical protein
MIHNRRMPMVSRAVAATAATSMLIAGCQAAASKYDTYSNAVRHDHYNVHGTPIEPLDKGDVETLADMICSESYTQVQRALAVLEGLEGAMQVPYQAGRIGKAYCGDWTGAFLTLTQAVRARYGPGAIFEIPQ